MRLHRIVFDLTADASLEEVEHYAAVLAVQAKGQARAMYGLEAVAVLRGVKPLASPEAGSNSSASSPSSSPSPQPGLPGLSTD
jgi:hypothetical protein